MSLPIIEAPIYSLTLPMSKKKIKIRPFLVREEKMLLTAMSEDNPEELADTIIQILNNCTFEKLDVGSISLIDIEYMLIKLRAYSKGETFDINVKCKNEVNGKVCGHISEYEKNVKDIKVDTSGIKNEVIKLSKTVGIKLQPPKANLISVLAKKQKIENITDNTIIDCIESIWDGDNVMLAKDHKIKDLENFVGQLTTIHLEKIKGYINSLPSIEVKLDHKCEKCGNTETLTIKGIYDFLE